MSILSDSTVLTPICTARLEPLQRPRPIAGIHAELGFPLPTAEYTEESIDLNELLVRNPPATFFYRCAGESMLAAGICDGDIVAVDRSVSPQDGDLVLAIWEGNAPSCKILRMRSDHIELHSAGTRVAPIVFESGADVEVFSIVAVVRQVIRGARKRC